jgi:hypothetical protein
VGVHAGRNEKQAKIGKSSRNCSKSANLCPSMATNVPYQIHTESRGPHWIAWVSRGDGKPEGSVVLVGATQEEAEARARRWAERQN